MDAFVWSTSAREHVLRALLGLIASDSEREARICIAGFENADMTALEQALRTDAAIEMVGTEPGSPAARRVCATSRA